MAKTVPAALATHLQGEATTLTTIWDIVRVDGTVVRLTELDADLVVGGETYESAYGYSRSAMTSRSSLDADDIDLEGILNSGFIDKDDVVDGLYNSATLTISLVNYLSPADGTMVLRRGRLGQIIITPSGRFSAELASLSSLLEQQILERASPTCRAELGDFRCTVPLNPDVRQDSTAYTVGQFVRVITDGVAVGQAQFENRIYECTTAGTTAASAPTYNETVGGTTADGTAVFTAREAFTRHAVVATVTDGRVFTITVDESRAVDDWFNLGTVTFESGDETDRTFEVKDWVQSSSQVTLFLGPRVAPQVGDALRIVPGCDKIVGTCRNKFDIPNSTDYANGNVANFRGEPYLPGRDAVLTYPDAQ